MSSEGEETSGEATIGISFGNSYSSIACATTSDVIVIANEEGDRQIPSVLSYVDGEEVHGTQAKALLIRNAKNTVACFRDFLGKRFDSIDPTPCQASAPPQALDSTVAFSIADSESSERSIVSVSEITTRYLRRLKHSASEYLGRSVVSAVVTVPTDFSDAQKEALAAAAKAAGIAVLQFVLEPIAALLAHDRHNIDKPQDKVVVVADLGGTRSDVAVVSIRGGMYTILATTHDYALGGVTLDTVLVDYFAKEFMKKHKTDPRKDQRGLAKLRLECEAVKKALSLGSSAGFNVESLADGIDFATTVNRSRFELLSGKVFGSFTRLIENAVEKADLDLLDVNELLLSGGTSHIPRIAENLRSHFPESTTVIAPSTSTTAINPSELTVRGAALQAQLIEGYEAEDIEQSTHPAVTVTPHLSQTIGIVLADADGKEQFRPVVFSETPLPVRRTLGFTVPAATENGVLIRLCEGIKDIKVTRPEPKPKVNGVADGEDGDDEDDDEDEEEEEELRERVWKIGDVVGELALKDAKKGSKVTLQLQIGSDLDVSISAMEVGTGKPGVKGQIPGLSSANGVAH